MSLDQWLSNILVAGPLAALKNYQEPQRDLACVGYVIQYLPY